MISLNILGEDTLHTGKPCKLSRLIPKPVLLPLCQRGFCSHYTRIKRQPQNYHTGKS